MACTMRICEITELRRFQSIQANRVQVKLVRTSGISCAGTDDLREWLSSDILLEMDKRTRVRRTQVASSSSLGWGCRRRGCCLLEGVRPDPRRRRSQSDSGITRSFQRRA
jgi:hypothetical protein